MPVKTSTGKIIDMKKAPDFITPLKFRMNCTPDWREMKTKKLIPVFIFSDYQEKMFGSSFFDREVYIGRGRTASATYKMIVNNQGVAEVYHSQVYGNRAIAGDIYLISPKKLMELDTIEKNTVFTDRSKEYIYAEDQVYSNGLMPSMLCWMYLCPGPPFKDSAENSFLSIKEYKAEKKISHTSEHLPIVQEYCLFI